MPRSASPFRVEACRELGAEVELVEDVHRAFERVREIEAEEGRTFVHPFEGPGTILGTATLGLELMEQVPDLDAVVVPVGGGGLCAGVAAAVKLARPECAVYGVEPQGADSMHRSFEAGSPQSIEAVRTIADSLGAPHAAPYSFGLCRRFVDDLALVDDDALRRAMLLLFRSAKLAVEPAGAAATAALCGPLRDRLRGKRVGLIVCGANIDAASFSRHLADAQAPTQGRARGNGRARTEFTSVSVRGFRWRTQRLLKTAHGGRGALQGQYGRILATLIRLVGDSDLAEESLGCGTTVALEQWPREGVPLTVAWSYRLRRKAIDRLRRRPGSRRRDEIERHLRQLAPQTRHSRRGPAAHLACCHPTLAGDAHRPGLRTVCLRGDRPGLPAARRHARAAAGAGQDEDTPGPHPLRGPVGLKPARATRCGAGRRVPRVQPADTRQLARGSCAPTV
jgi:hypothetical protein